MKIQFENVGRNDKSWELDLKDVDIDTDEAEVAMLESIRRSGALLSSNVWLSGDLTGGYVNAGFHTVGKWRVAP